jgi:hypothetical protein
VSRSPAQADRNPACAWASSPRSPLPSPGLTRTRRAPSRAPLSGQAQITDRRGRRPRQRRRAASAPCRCRARRRRSCVRRNSDPRSCRYRCYPCRSRPVRRRRRIRTDCRPWQSGRPASPRTPWVAHHRRPPRPSSGSRAGRPRRKQRTIPVVPCLRYVRRRPAPSSKSRCCSPCRSTVARLRRRRHTDCRLPRPGNRALPGTPWEARRHPRQARSLGSRAVRWPRTRCTSRPLPYQRCGRRMPGPPCRRHRCPCRNRVDRRHHRPRIGCRWR